MNDVTVQPIRMVFGSSGLKAFAYWLELFGNELESKGNALRYPIIVDRLYKLTDIEHAFEYATDHDVAEQDYVLGEHIGLSINQLEEGQLIQSDSKTKEVKVWRPYQLLDVDNYEKHRAHPLSDHD